ncbi:hypothetical protein BG011_007441 [Mortierella polycephala]|uniref:Uncharacterized protein n=1 Tax=Mortierella polycephala TaxID=41804 RepID=A0A9P6PQ57_9FUNG|nr:hypothetical protein BG011_007441 [Mortierella polycephala]
MSFGKMYKQKSILETYIERACDPLRFEPDLALNLEICDVIKEKQKNTNNMHIAMLALNLLDNCVKNCGHPFHLQISTKEFLNALVRRFPERPLAVPTPVQTRVLEMIHEWYTTLFKTSRIQVLASPKANCSYDTPDHCEFIGLFDQPRSRNILFSIKSPAELEEEDRIAQAAKLQELVRRGRPEDVRAANELVKKMTGFEQDDKPDYAEQASAELNKLMRNASLLIEMLNDVKPGEIIGRGDIFEEIFETCKAAYPKVQKIISENKDPDNIDKLLELNDVLNNVIEQYNQVKSGNLVKAAVPSVSDIEKPSERKQDHGVKSISTPKESSLIDLLDFDGSSSATAPKIAGGLADDLMNLSFQDTPPPPSWGVAGSINLGQTNNSTPITTQSSSAFNGAGGLNYNVFSSPVTSVNPVNVGSSLPIAQSSQKLVQSPKPANVSPLDDFEFVSNTGAPQTGGSINVLLMSKNGFQVDLDIEKQSGPAEKIYKITAYFSNNQNSAISALTFKVAVPRSLRLKLDPQSAQVVAPFSKKSVTQSMTIQCPADATVVRMRYHVSYTVAGKLIEDQGEFSQFP